jgi:hypothetical protein
MPPPRRRRWKKAFYEGCDQISGRITELVPVPVEDNPPERVVLQREPLALETGHLRQML